MILYHNLDALLHTYLSRAQTSVRIYSPYVRSSALKRLHGALGKDVAVAITMRWGRQEFAQGASDPDVFTFCAAQGITLQKHPSVHLKMFIADDRDLIAASANLTDRGLGVSGSPNVEFMATGFLVTETDREVFNDLDTLATPVSAADYDMAMEAFRPDRSEDDTQEPAPGAMLDQIPGAETPLALWQTYKGNSNEPSSVHELRRLRLPPGLSEDEFLRVVGADFFARPLLKALTTRLRLGDLYFGELKQWLLSACADADDIRAWDLSEPTGRLLNWVEGLGPPRYTVDRPRHSERLSYETGIPQDAVLRAVGVRRNVHSGEET